MNQFQSTLVNGIKYLLFLTALTPLIVTKLTPFPFVAGKTFFYRGLIEAAILFLAAYLLTGINRLKSASIGGLKNLFKNKLFLFLSLFILSALISTIFAPNSYRAFFGDIERGEGFLGFLHYFIFAVLAIAVFRQSDWLNFFKLSLVVLLVMIFYAWLQFFEITEFPFALGASGQPGSFTGNPAFFSSYLIISLAVAAVVFFSSKRKSFWRYLSTAIAVLAFSTVFITGIRGAILGLAAGVLFLLIYFSIYGHRKAVRLAMSLILLLAIFGGIFWFTRPADFWQNIPGIKRFAKVSFDIPSVTTRFIALGVSWDAFKEKPIFGWGPENYNIAYNKHYNPRYALYAEDWFDRAHNKIAEVAVVQGGVGLAAYLGIFAAVFYLLFRTRLHPDNSRITDSSVSIRQNPYLAVFLGAALVAYFVQNLFLFDNITSYLLFFAVLGFLVAPPSNIRTADVQNIDVNVRTSAVRKLISSLVAVVIIAVSLYSLYAYIYVPYIQAKRYILATRLRVGDKILAATERFLKPYTFVQLTVRSQLHDFLYNNNLFARPDFRPLIDKSLNALEEASAREPYDPRHFARLIEGYNELAKADEKFFAKSQNFAEKALALSPRRQGLLSHLAFTLAGQKKYEEAIKVGRRSVSLAPNSAKAHLNLGITLALAAEDKNNKGTAVGEAYKEEALKELDKALGLGYTYLGGGERYEGSDLSNTQFLLFIDFDFKNMMTIYRGFGRLDKVFEVLKIALNEKLSTATNEDFLHDGIVLGRYFRDKDAIVKYATRLKEINPSLVEDMNVIIDLAEKEKWEILDTL